MKRSKKLDDIDQTWTLFLDRDGVINEEKHMDYIHSWDEFRFYEGALEALGIFARTFGRIIIVTNQRGIGKGVTRQDNLDQLHANMQQAIVKNGGRVDAIYYCPDINDDSPNRKPNPGMGLQAIAQFPEIDPGKAIMVGNTLSDMQFGRNLGTINVFLTTTRPEVDVEDERIDIVHNSLIEFAYTIPRTPEMG